MLVNDECSSWFDGVGDLLVSVWEGWKEISYSNGSSCTTQWNNPTPERMVNGTECYDSWVWVIYSFIYSFSFTYHHVVFNVMVLQLSLNSILTGRQEKNNNNNNNIQHKTVLHKQTNKPTNTQIYRERDRQTDRQTERMVLGILVGRSDSQKLHTL